MMDKQTIEQRLRDLMDAASELPAPGRYRIVKGRGKAIAVLWVDATSDRTLGEIIGAHPEELKNEKLNILRQIDINTDRTRDLILQGTEDAIALAENLTDWSKSLLGKVKEIDQQMGAGGTPQELAFQILSCAASAAEKLYHDPEKMRAFFVTMSNTLSKLKE